MAAAAAPTGKRKQPAVSAAAEAKKVVDTEGKKGVATWLYLYMKHNDAKKNVDMRRWLRAVATVPFYLSYSPTAIEDEKERIEKIYTVPNAAVLMATDARPRIWSNNNLMCEFATRVLLGENDLGPPVIDAWYQRKGFVNLKKAIWLGTDPTDIDPTMDREMGTIAVISAPRMTIGQFAHSFGVPKALEDAVFELVHRAHSLGISLNLLNTHKFGDGMFQVVYPHGQYGWRPLSDDLKRFRSYKDALLDYDFGAREQAAALSQTSYRVWFSRGRYAEHASILGDAMEVLSLDENNDIAAVWTMLTEMKLWKGREGRPDYWDNINANVANFPDPF